MELRCQQRPEWTEEATRVEKNRMLPVRGREERRLATVLLEQVH